MIEITGKSFPVRHLATLLLLVSSTVHAKSWNGIEPGVTHREDLIKRFGPASKTVTVEGKQVLAYTGPNAIKGTSQAQFRVDPGSGIVERIDVFPGPAVDKDAVESTYGPACPTSGAAPVTPCHQKKLTDEFRTYWLYPRLGLAVFFDDDGEKVESFVYQAVKVSRPP